MSSFAVAAFYDAQLPAAATRVEGIVWIRAAGLGADGVDVSLQLWTPCGARLTALTEVAPTSADLLPRATRADDRTLLVDAGSWADGVHEYELEVALPPRDAGEEMLAARVGVVAGDEIAGTALIAVRWSEAARSAAAAGSPADLPTGAPSQPPEAIGGDLGAGAPCRGCGELPEEGDRFCEACGRELSAPP